MKMLVTSFISGLLNDKGAKIFCARENCNEKFKYHKEILDMKMIVMCCVCLSVFFASGRGKSQNMDAQKQGLLQAEQQFLQSAEENGIVASLLQVLSDDAVVLPQNGHPIVGKEALQNLASAVSLDPLTNMKDFESLRMDVSSSGNFGYTYGRYRIADSDSSQEKEAQYGYYLSVWRRDSGKRWKMFLNRGLFWLEISNEEPKDLSLDTESLQEKKSLVEAELAFSQLSIEKGMVAAFYQFMADDGLAISGSGPPATRETYRKALEKQKEKPKSRLEWKPIFSEVAESGDLGCNMGPYMYTAVDSEGKKQSLFGYFMTVWKKQSDGNWRFVIDGGNQSPAPKKAEESEP